MRLFILSVFVLCPMSATDCFGQSTTDAERLDRRRSMVEDILRNLIDTQFQDASYQPATTTSATTIAAPQWQALRRDVTAFSQGADRLIDDLEREERYSPSIRPLIGDALHIRALADVLSQRAGQYSDKQILSRDFTSLDSQWRTLSHRLRQIPNMGADTLAHVEQLNQLDQRIGQALGVTAQLDRDELDRLIIAMSSDLGNLLEDVRLDYRNRSTREPLLARGRNIELRLRQLQGMIQTNRDHKSVLAVYRPLREQWRDFAAALREIDNRYVHRNVQRMDQLFGKLDEHLWQQTGIDMNQISYLTQALTRDVNRICDNITLTRLVQLPNAGEVVSTAQECYVLARDFSESVSSNAAIEDLLWDYRVLEVQWDEMRQLVMGLENSNADQYVAIVDESITGLRDALGVRQSVDQRETVELAATLDDLSERLHRDVINYIARSQRYPTDFRNKTKDASNQFHDVAHYLHEQVGTRANLSDLKMATLDMARRWNNLATYLRQVPADEQRLFVGTASEITPVMAQLQMIYAY